jgi:hypothetical protein
MHGADQGLQLQHSLLDEMVIESPGDEARAFWEQFKLTFEECANDNFADRMHPLSSLNWKLRLEEGDATFYREQPSRSARQALNRSATHGLREAGVDLPLMMWLKERQGILADFLRDSVSNTSEESVTPKELSYHVVERSWWDRLSNSSGLRYGIRPFRTAPYAYAGIGFRDGDRVFLLANVRYAFRDFAQHKFELALSLPLMNGISVDVGATYKLNRGNSEERFVLKLFKNLDRGGMFYVAMELREAPAVYSGISFAF